MADDEGFRVKTHQSLMRPKLMLGAEPNLLYLSAGMCGLAFATSDIRGYLLGGIGWLVILFVLRWLAKNVDPRAYEIYLRYSNYRAYMPAQPSIIAPHPLSREMQ